MMELRMRIPTRLSKQAGVSSLHMVALLVILGLAQVALAGYQMRRASSTLGQAVGGQAKAIKEGVDNYLKTFGPHIVAQKIVAKDGITVADPLKPTLQELTDLGFLYALPGKPANGGEWQIVIERHPTTCNLPGPCNLRSTIIPTNPMVSRADPDTIDGTALDAAIDEIGSDGGYSEFTAPDVINGAGGWVRPNKLGSIPGVLHVIGGYGSATYEAPLNVGDECTVPGAVRTATTGEQLICRGTQWVTTIKSLSNYSTGRKVLVKDGDIVPKPVCEPGAFPAYSYEMTQTAVDVAIAPPLQSMYLATTEVTTGWQIVIHMKDKNTKDVSANPYAVTAIFHVQCFYP